MNSDADAILARELGRLGGFGARWVSRILPPNVGQQVLHHRSNVGAARRIVETVLRDLGQIEPEPLGGPDSVSAVVGCGYGRLNPALVTVSVSECDTGSEIQVRAVAKEGLIRQRGGEQVAGEVANALAKALADALPLAERVGEKVDKH